MNCSNRFFSPCKRTDFFIFLISPNPQLKVGTALFTGLCSRTAAAKPPWTGLWRPDEKSSPGLGQKMLSFRGNQIYFYLPIKFSQKHFSLRQVINNIREYVSYVIQVPDRSPE